MVQDSHPLTALTQTRLGSSCWLVVDDDGHAIVERRAPGSLELIHETARPEDRRLAAVLAWVEALPEPLAVLWGELCAVYRADTTSGRWAVVATATGPYGRTHVLRSLREVMEGVCERGRPSCETLPEEALPF